MAKLPQDGEVRRGEAGVGDDGGDVEGRDAQRMRRRHSLADVPDGRQPDRKQRHENERLDLLVDRAAAAALDDEDGVERQRQGAGHHEDFGHDLDRHGIVEADRCVLGREAAGRDRGHRMVDGVEGGHAGRRHADRAGERQRHVDDGDDLGELAHLRERLLRDVGGFGMKELHAADAQGRQHAQRHDDDADAADPVEQRAPHQQALRHGVEAGEHGRAGRRQARHGLEQRIGVADVERGEEERQCAEGAGRKPGGDGDEIAGAPVGQAEVGTPEAGRQRRADDADDDRACAEVQRVAAAARQEVDGGRNEHQRGHGHQEEPVDEQDEMQAFGASCPCGSANWSRPAMPQPLPGHPAASRRRDGRSRADDMPSAATA